MCSIILRIRVYYRVPINQINNVLIICAKTDVVLRGLNIRLCFLRLTNVKQDKFGVVNFGIKSKVPPNTTYNTQLKG